MTPRLIRDLLLIAAETNKWPRLKHLREESLAALEAAHVSTIETITPVYVTNNGKDEENANDDLQSRSFERDQPS